MKKRLSATILLVILTFGNTAYGAAEEKHWIMKELPGYSQDIVPYKESALPHGTITLEEWKSFQQNVLDTRNMDKPICLGDWATALKMAADLPEKNRETLVDVYVYGLGDGTEITRENAVGGMVKLLIASYFKGSWSEEELKPAHAILDRNEMNEKQKSLVEIAYVQGILDDTVIEQFRPNDKLTNAEAISMMARVMKNFAYDKPDLPANHWLNDELETAYQSGKLPKPMLKVIRHALQDPTNADRPLPVTLWHEMLVTGLPVPTYVRDNAWMYTLAYDQDGGILRDRAIIGVTKLGANTRSATAEEKKDAEAAFNDYDYAIDSDKMAVAYGDGLLEGRSGPIFGVHGYLTYAEAIALAARASLRETLNVTPLLIDEAVALQIAKKMDPNSEAEWKVRFKKSLVLHYNGNRQIYDGWVVEAVYPAGNKLVVYIDARNGKIMVVSEIEAERS